MRTSRTFRYFQPSCDDHRLGGRAGAGATKPSFSGAAVQPVAMAPGRPGTLPLPASIRTELNRLFRARRRNSQAIARASRARTLADTRAWAVECRARTRHLIELGCLVQKAGLVALADDDRATMLGAFMELADRLRGADDTGDDPRHRAARWRRRGLRAFDADRSPSADGQQQPRQDLPHGTYQVGERFSRDVTLDADSISRFEQEPLFRAG
jgi:hypothetical protein